jgi:Leucine-rich repeat (LRR) protein
MKAKFKNILIYGNIDLESIESEVFVKSQINSFNVKKNPKISDNSIFDLIKSLNPLVVILSSNAFEEIPENAFDNQQNPINNRLSHISLDHNKLKVITSNAFTGLKNLSYLSLDHNMISTIEDFGLKLSTVSSH